MFKKIGRVKLLNGKFRDCWEDPRDPPGNPPSEYEYPIRIRLNGSLNYRHRYYGLGDVLKVWSGEYHDLAERDLAMMCFEQF